jgi:tetratricopeptide (TPR) repeat protein
VTTSVRSGATDCDGGIEDAAAVWGPQQRIALGAKLASFDTPYAREAEARVLAGLDAHTNRWSVGHRAACLDHRRGTESATLLDRRMLCLRQRLGDLAAAVSVLQSTGIDGLAHAVDVVAGLPSAAMCADVARLLAEVDPPATPELRSQVAVVRAQVSMAVALSRAGRAEESVTMIRAANVEAKTTRYQPVIAEAQLEYGRILILQGAYNDATPVLLDAMKTALASNLLHLAIEAAARRIYTEGKQSGDLDRLGRDLDYVESMSRSLVGDHFVRPLLLNNIGIVYMAAKRRDEALRYFQLAHDAMAGDESPDPELMFIDQNIAMLTSDAVSRATLSRGVWSRLNAALGEHHLATLQSLVMYALFCADTAMAYQLIAPACADYRSMHRTLVKPYVACESARGFLAAELEKHEAAQAAYSAIIDATAASSDPDLVVLRHLAAGELALLRGMSGQAIENFEAVINARGNTVYWWKHKDVLQAELGLGLATSAVGGSAAAVRHLDAAANGFAELVLLNEGIVYRLRLAKARRGLAAVPSDFPEQDRIHRH